MFQRRAFFREFRASREVLCTIEEDGAVDERRVNARVDAERMSVPDCEISIFANGGRVIFFRNVASVTMDLNDVEGITFNALGGADTVVVHDLSGTDVTEINLNLAGVLGGTAGDAQPDTVVVLGTNGSDVAVVNQAVGLSRTPPVIDRPTPSLGQHTEAILMELGYDKVAIADLRERKVV